MARRITANLSAPDFVDAVIQALGEACRFQANVDVDSKLIVSRVLELMGITSVDEYGFMDEANRKRPYVERWIGGAFRSTRADYGANPALGIQSGRGQWALTPEGVDRAAQLADAITPDLDLGSTPTPVPVPASFDDLPVVEVEEVVEAAPVVNDPVEAPLATLTNGVSITRPLVPAPAPVLPAPEPAPRFVPIRKDLGKGVALAVAQPVQGYHPDPYIVSLAAAETACFGYHSTRSQICFTCPLQETCIGAVRGRIEALAVKFRDGLKARERRMRDGEDVDDVVARAFADAPAEAPTKPRDPQWAEHDKIAAPIAAAGEAICFRCGEKIAKGTHILWATGVGMWHKTC